MKFMTRLSKIITKTGEIQIKNPSNDFLIPWGWSNILYTLFSPCFNLYYLGVTQLLKLAMLPLAPGPSHIGFPLPGASSSPTPPPTPQLLPPSPPHGPQVLV